MKTFEELTNHEISELTDEQIKHYCDLACAEFGAPLMPPRPGKPEPVEIEGESHLVEIGNWYFSPDDGAKVMSVLASVTIHKRENWDKPYYCKIVTASDYDYPKMAGVAMLTAEQYDRHREELVKYREAVTQYESDRKAFDEAVKKRGEATDWIYKKLREARDDVSYRTTRIADFNEYFKLADGNRKTAIRFLLKAYPRLWDEAYGDLLLSLYPEFDREVLRGELTSPVPSEASQ